MQNRPLRIDVVLYVGAAALVIGSLLPWATLTAPFVGRISRAGIDDGGDGVFTAMIGIAAAILAWKNGDGGTKKTAIALGLLGAAAAGIVLWDGYDIAAVEDEDIANISVGSGLYVAGAGAVALIVGAWLTWERAPGETD